MKINRLYKFIDYGYILSPRVDGTLQRLRCAASEINIQSPRDSVAKCRPL